MAKDDDKIWDNLKKEYLTTEQKIAIIREHNERISEVTWNKSIDAIRDYLNNKDK